MFCWCSGAGKHVWRKCCLNTSTFLFGMGLAGVLVSSMFLFDATLSAMPVFAHCERLQASPAPGHYCLLAYACQEPEKAAELNCLCRVVVHSCARRRTTVLLLVQLTHFLHSAHHAHAHLHLMPCLCSHYSGIPRVLEPCLPNRSIRPACRRAAYRQAEHAVVSGASLKHQGGCSHQVLGPKASHAAATHCSMQHAAAPTECGRGACCQRYKRNVWQYTHHGGLDATPHEGQGPGPIPEQRSGPGGTNSNRGPGRCCLRLQWRTRASDDLPPGPAVPLWDRPRSE